MTSLLFEQLFTSLAHAAQHPNMTFSHPKMRPVVVSSTKNLRRVHKLRKHKSRELLRSSISEPVHTISSSPVMQDVSSEKVELIDSIAQEISLARDVAHELYVSEELSRDDWIQTKELLKHLSEELVERKEHFLN